MIKFKYVIMLWVYIALASGCATPTALRTTKPSLKLISEKSAKIVSTCIANKWENLGLFGVTIPVNMRPTELGFTLSVRNEVWGHTQLLADVIEEKLGSSTLYFKGAVIGTSSFDHAVEVCQN